MFFFFRCVVFVFLLSLFPALFSLIHQYFDIIPSDFQQFIELIAAERSKKVTQSLRIQFCHLFLGQTGKENRQAFLTESLDLFFCQVRQHHRYDLRIDRFDLLRFKVFRKALKHKRKCLIVQQRGCRRELRGKIRLLFFAQFIEHSREKRSPLRLFLFFLREDHELVKHSSKPGAALVFGHVQQDLPQKGRHLLRVVHRGVTGLSCSEIDLNVIVRIQQHDVLDPRFLKFLSLVQDGQFDIELLRLQFLRYFLPFLNEIFGHDHGVPFAKKNIRGKFRSQNFIFRSLADRLCVSSQDLLVYRSLCQNFCRICLYKVSDEAEIASVGIRGSVFQRLDILLSDLDVQLNFLPLYLFLFKAQPGALRVIAKQHIALADDLSFLYGNFLNFLRVREIYILLRFRGDLSRHVVLPVQIVSIVEI